MIFFNFKKRENRIPFQVWEVRNPILPKPRLPIKLIRKFHKIRKDQPERRNFLIGL